MVTEESKVFQVVYDYSDVPTLKKFTVDNSRVRMVMGAFGCLRGDQLIVTEEGLLPISHLTHPMRVLGWNEKSNQFQFSLSGGAFPKGKDYLYRISTPRGVFVAAGHHRVLLSDHMYRQVSELHRGDVLSQCSFSHLQKYVFEDQKSSCKDDLHSFGKSEGYLDRYVKLIRLYGQRLHWGVNFYPIFVPSQGGAQELSKYFCSDVFLRSDDFQELLLGHTLSCQSFDLIHIGGYSSQVALHNEVEVNYIFLQFFQRIFFLLPQFLLSLYKTLFHHIKKLFLEYFHSLKSSSLSDGAILSIERLNVKEYFWDMQVDETHNYVTADGTIHHNSGKSSACVFDIIRRANEQKPSPDGIRRSRWAVVRNSYTQLKDTTIKTFHDWFPPRLFGEYRVTDHTYIITKFPNVHLEVLFRALDRPDQVSNLLSLELTGAWFNEAREIPMTIIDAMDGRIGRYPSERDGGPSWYGMIMDTNPPDDGSMLYKRFEVIRPENWKIFKQPSGLSAHAENTTHLPKNYYINLAKGKDEMYKRIYIDGQYGYLVNGKPVFQSFKDNIHVASHQLEPQKGLDVLTGFDFGLSPCCVIAQITPLGQLRILDELVSDGMGLRQFCENQLLPLLRLKYFGMNVVGFGDPSGVSRAPTDESTCFEILQSPEIGLRNVTPAPTNAILPRVAAVENFLNKMYAGEPSFILSPNCYYLRKAMNGGYHYEKEPRSLGEEYKIMPVKNFSSHICDALQYLCMFIAEKDVHDKRWKDLSSRVNLTDYKPVNSIGGY